MSPFNLSASNACVGWPSSSITKFEMSTMLLIERMPTLSIFARNHCGLGPTLTFSILRAEKNGHSRVALIVTPVFLIAIFGVARRRFEFLSGQRRNFARQTVMAEQIAAIRRDLDVENRVAREKIAKSARRFLRPATKSKDRPHLRRDRARSRCKAFLRDSTPRSLLFRISVPFGNFAPGKRERNFVADFVIGRAANDLAFRSAAIVDFANAQTIGIRMTRDAVICETITLSIFAPRVSMFSVSTPARVSKSASSSGFSGRSTNSRSQLTENFMLRFLSFRA